MIEHKIGNPLEPYLTELQAELANFPIKEGHTLKYDAELVNDTTDFSSDNVILRFKNFRYERIIYFEDD